MSVAPPSLAPLPLADRAAAVMPAPDRPLRQALRANPLGLGAAALAGLYDAVDEATAAATLQAAWDAGLRCIDTAPFYGYTRSEHRVGAFLAGRPRDGLVLSTKVGRLLRPDASVRPGSDGWADPLPFRPVFDYGYDGVMRSFEDSLSRLGGARIDLLLVHDIGRATHGQQHGRHWRALTQGRGFRALESLRDQGAVQAIGLGVNEWEVAWDALSAAPIDCVLLAGRYTLLEQGALGFMDRCAADGVDVLIGGPFNSGLLAGQAKYDYGAVPAAVRESAEALAAVCAEFQVPLPAAALQFPLAHPAVANVLSGMRSPDQVRRNVDWMRQPIPGALWRALRDRGLIHAGVPLPDEPGAG